MLPMELVVREGWNLTISRIGPRIIQWLREWVNGISDAGEEGAASEVSIFSELNSRLWRPVWTDRTQYCLAQGTSVSRDLV